MKKAILLVLFLVSCGLATAGNFTGDQCAPFKSIGFMVDLDSGERIKTEVPKLFISSPTLFVCMDGKEMHYDFSLAEANGEDGVMLYCK